MSRQIRLVGLSKTIECPIGDRNQVKHRFADNILLLDKAVVHGLFLSVQVQQTTTGRNIGPFLYSYLTLAGYNNEQYSNRLPLYLFTRRQLSPVIPKFNTNLLFSELLFIKPKLISFRNSYIEIPPASIAALPTSVAFSLQLTVFYDLYDERVHKFDRYGELIENAD